MMIVVVVVRVVMMVALAAIRNTNIKLTVCHCYMISCQSTLRILTHSVLTKTL